MALGGLGFQGANVSSMSLFFLHGSFISSARMGKEPMRRKGAEESSVVDVSVLLTSQLLSSLLKVQVLNFVCFSQQVRSIKEAAIALLRRGPLCRGHAPASGQLTSLVFLPRVKFTE